MVNTKEMNKLRKKFVKDEKIPIPVFEENAFFYFLDLYENMFQAKTKYRHYEKLIDNLGWENYQNKYNLFKDLVIQHVKDKSSYQTFNTLDMNSYGVKRNSNNFLTRQFYVTENTGKKWISIDFKQANFHTLKHINPELVDFSDTYEDWILSFENGELFGHLKSIRQIVFGNLNPKRQQKVQSYLLNQFMEKLDREMEGLTFWVMGSDEFMIEFSEDVDHWLEEYIPVFEKESSMKLKKEFFTLEKNGAPSEFGFIKKTEDQKKELISVNKHFFAQAYKYLENLELEPYDLMFYHENQIATFMRPLNMKEMCLSFANKYYKDSSHPLHVAETFEELSDEWLVGLYHDLLEDTPATKEKLASHLKQFNKEYLVQHIVELTRKEDETYFDYIRRLDGLSKEVKIQDVLNNLSRKETLSESLKERYEKALRLLRKEQGVVHE